MIRKNAKVITKEECFSCAPKWVSQACVYQIFPDRFRRSGRVPAQQNLTFEPWNQSPTQLGFKGGDLFGVIDSLDYIQGLGINCIYLNPIFSSSANHRYHSYDYFQVDPLLGGNEALEDLINELHRRGMRIILDGVFNHCGRGFWAFNHLLENGQSSPYKDWFHVHQWPLKPFPKVNEECGYSCWWNDPALPKFNHCFSPVREYLMRVATYWIDKGIDGWRLDVPDEIPIDFWDEFRIEVKNKNKEAWILGEIWGDAKLWLDGKKFDGVMNYRIGWAILCWLGNEKLNNRYQNPLYPLKAIDGKKFIEILQLSFSSYAPQFSKSHLNLLDSHDVPRALNTLNGDIKALKLALFLLYIQPGATCVYYGTETGLLGGKEPQCREAFPWENIRSVNLTEFVKSLSVMRNKLLPCFNSSMEYEIMGEHGLAINSIESNTSDKMKSRTIKLFINRSKNSCLSILEEFEEEIFSIGDIDSTNCLIGPQSALVMRCK